MSKHKKQDAETVTDPLSLSTFLQTDSVPHALDSGSSECLSGYPTISLT